MLNARQHPVTVARALVTLSLIVALGDALARATIALIAADAAPTGVGALAVNAAGPESAQRATPDQLARTIAGNHLFGRRQAPTATTPMPAAAPSPPKARLNLELNGIFLSAQGRDLAIIGTPNGAQQAYRIGATINNRAALIAIHENHVVLRHDDRTTPLYLNKPPPTTASTHAKPIAPPPASRANATDSRVAIAANSELGLWLTRQRSVWRQNPITLMQVANIQPAMAQGRLRGYRLAPANDQGLLRQIGLRASDILTTLNDIPLTNPAKVAGAMTQLIHADTLTLTVLRQGRPHRITVSFTPS